MLFSEKKVSSLTPSLKSCTGQVTKPRCSRRFWVGLLQKDPEWRDRWEDFGHITHILLVHTKSFRKVLRSPARLVAVHFLSFACRFIRIRKNNPYFCSVLYTNIGTANGVVFGSWHRLSPHTTQWLSTTSPGTACFVQSQLRSACLSASCEWQFHTRSRMTSRVS